jgi:two-component sensor histidine kinase
MTKKLTQRLTSLDRAHDLVRPLPGSEGKAALLGDLLSVLLQPYDDTVAFGGRIRVAVPRMGVGEKAATTLALVFHELATNSVKHGALSAEAGFLDISSQPDERDVVVIWAETGGPCIEQAPEMQGFGSKLIARSLSQQLHGTIEYDWQKNGLVVTLRMRRHRLAT